MEFFELWTHLKDVTRDLQFAYRANWSVDDADNFCLHYILQYLDYTGTYTRILFLDFNSAFNTIVADILSSKLSQLTVSPAMCQWITKFWQTGSSRCNWEKWCPTIRLLTLWFLKKIYSALSSSSLYTNDCTSNDWWVKLLKFVDVTTVMTSLCIGRRLNGWCLPNNLELNKPNTVEMRVELRRCPTALLALTISNSPVSSVETFRFLSTTISHDLKWETSIIKKAQQRMYFLYQLRKLCLRCCWSGSTPQSLSPTCLPQSQYYTVQEQIAANCEDCWENHRNLAVGHSGQKTGIKIQCRILVSCL